MANSKKCSALFYEMQVKILFREFDLFDHVNFTAYWKFPHNIYPLILYHKYIIKYMEQGIHK